MKYSMTQEKLEKIAKQYLEEEISIKNLAKEHHVGKDNLIKFLKGEKDIKLSSEMQKRIDDRKKQRWKDSKATSGNKGSYIFTDEQLIALAKCYVDGDSLVLRDIAAQKGVSPATIYNNFTQESLGYELYEQVNEKYEFNKANASSKRTKK